MEASTLAEGFTRANGFRSAFGFVDKENAESMVVAVVEGKAESGHEPATLSQIRRVTVTVTFWSQADLRQPEGWHFVPPCRSRTGPLDTLHTGEHSVIVLFNIAELKDTQTVFLRRCDSLPHLLQHLRIRLQVSATLAVDGGQALTEKVDVDGGQGFCMILGVHQAQMTELAILEVSVCD